MLLSINFMKNIIIKEFWKNKAFTPENVNSLFYVEDSEAYIAISLVKKQS